MTAGQEVGDDAAAAAAEAAAVQPFRLCVGQGTLLGNGSQGKG